eukprot:gene1501-1747_t
MNRKAFKCKSSQDQERECYYSDFDQSLFVNLKGGDFEESWNAGWSANSTAHCHSNMWDPTPYDIGPYEGSSFAFFVDNNSMMQSRPLLFPNMTEGAPRTNNTPLYYLYDTLHLDYYYQIIGSYGATSFLSISLNDTEIDRISPSTPTPGPPVPEASGMYYRRSIDLTQYANGSTYILTIKYNDTSFNSDLYALDLFTFISRPATLVNDNIYVGRYGNDTTGNGTIVNPFHTVQRAMNVIATSGYKVFVEGVMPMQYHNNLSPYVVDFIGKSVALESVNRHNQSQIYLNAAPMFLISSQNISISDIQIYGGGSQYNTLGRGGLFTVAVGAKLWLSNLNQNKSEAYAPILGISSVIDSHPLSTVHIANCNFENNLGPTFVYRSALTVVNSLIMKNEEVIFLSLDLRTTLFVDRCNFTSGTSMFNTTQFDSITMINSQMTAYTAEETFTSDNLYHGNTVYFDNNIYLDSALPILITWVNNITWTNCLFIQPQSLIFSTIQLTSGALLSNLTFQSALQSTFSLIYVEDNLPYDPLIIDNCTFIGNACPLLMSKHAYVTVINSNIADNSEDILFMLSYTVATMSNLTVTSNLYSLISCMDGIVLMSNSTFLSNNNPTLTPTPFILLQTCALSSFTNLTFSNNFNFNLFQITGYADSPGAEIIIDSVIFANNYIGDLIQVNLQSVQISNISVTNNFLSTYYPIRLVNHAQLTLSNAVFQSNTQYLLADASTFSITNVQWNDVHTIADQAFLVTGGSSGNITNCSLFRSDPNSGMLFVDSSLSFVNVTFILLTSYDDPLGVYTGSNVTFDSCTFANSSAGNSLMAINTMSTVNFDSCVFYNLSSPTILIDIDISDVTIVNSIVKATNCGSVGFQVTGSSLVIDYTKFIDNYFVMGQAIMSINSNFSATNSEFTFNDASFEFAESSASFTNCELCDNTVSLIFISIIEGDLVLNNCTLSRNASPLTSALIVATQSTINIIDSLLSDHILPRANGSIVNAASSVVNITSSTITRNVAQYGAVYLQKSSATITDSDFSFNTATSGPAIFVQTSSINIVDSTFINNSITTGSVRSTQYDLCGGVGTILDSSLNISQSLFRQNIASLNGGVFYLSSSTANSTTSSYFYNQASYGAGGICYSPLPTCFFDGTNPMEQNSATYGLSQATPPQTLLIEFTSNGGNNADDILTSTSFHPYTPFTAKVMLLDGYSEVVTTLGSPVDLYLNLTGPSINITYPPVINTLRGWLMQPITLNGSIGDQYIMTAYASNGMYDMAVFNLTMCSPGYFPDTLTHTCTPCAAEEYGWDGHSPCIKCNTYYGTNKVLCPGTNEIYSQAGWWILPNTYPPTVYQCDPDICTKGSASQPQGCRANQLGLLCSECAQGYAKVKVFCERCTKTNYPLIIGLVGFLTLYIVVMTVYRVPSATVIMNVLAALQLIGVLGFNVRTVSIVPLFDFMVDYWSSSCLDYRFDYLVKSDISLGMIVLVLLAPLRLGIGKQLALRAFPRAQSFLLEPFDRSTLHNLFSHLITLYTPIAFLSLSLVACYQVGDNHYLANDVSVMCFSAGHIPLFSIACVLIIVVVIGVPVIIITQVRRKRASYFNKVFFTKYRQGYMWWDSIVLLRSLLFVGTTIITIDNSDTKALVLSSFGLLFTCLSWMCSPFKDKVHNDLEIHLNLILCLTSLVVNSRELGNADMASGAIITSIGVLPFLASAYCLYSLRRATKGQPALSSMAEDWDIPSSSSSVVSISASSSK